MKVDLVFEGGGVLGISFAGAYKALTENKYEVVRCAGTSAGSIISSLIIAGYSPEEMVRLIEETEFIQFMEKTSLAKIPILGKLVSLVFNDGIYKSSTIGSWMEKLLEKKGIRTFADVRENGESRLKIISADITKRRMLILPDDLPDYGISPDCFSIAKAVEMSCAIPYFFTPIVLHSADQGSYIVDGGLMSTFPIWIFDLKQPVRPTIGIKINEPPSYTSVGFHHLLAFTKDLIDAAINQNEMYLVRDKDMVRTVFIENDDKIKATDFDLSTADINQLYKAGYESTKKFIHEFSFTDYVKRFLS